MSPNAPDTTGQSEDIAAFADFQGNEVRQAIADARAVLARLEAAPAADAARGTGQSAGTPAATATGDTAGDTAGDAAGEVTGDAGGSVSGQNP